MSGGRVTIWTRSSGPVEVECFPTPVPGLVINESPFGDGWSVTHRRSGAALLLGLPDPEQALHLAIALADVTDWTADGKALREDRAVRKRWWSALNDLEALSYSEGPLMPDAVLAGAS